MHGIKVNELTTGARPIVPIASAVIGLVATATADAGPPAAALDAAFPLNTPVLVTDIRSAIGDAGEGGTLLPALEAIADQTSPILVVVRVAPGEDDAETAANVIGGNTGGVATGMQCLLDAQAQLGIRPRILGCPGLDVQEVTAEMVIIAKRLRAMVYARAIGDEIADVLTYREEFSARELMLVWPNFTNQFAGDAVARAMGLRARIDEEQGWHKTLSNVAVDGVSGIDKSVYFDLQDATTPAGVLNDGQVTTIIRMNGYRFWGNRTCSDLPEFAFESAVRTAQVLQDTIAEGLAWAVDKPMTRGLIKDIIETINAEFRSLKAQGRLIDGKAWFDPALNSQTDLASGRLTIDYDFTPTAPAENIILNQRITDRYYAGFADQLN
ncbi:phage tail sheath protein [Sphingomonas ursincola]|uniref:Phage tail protein n=1 Tax=Sphingomonas ursincola TaxID=56361 RepID=A0A7V8RB11_9SPHN|nr:phage tail sheath subtilisin-like domain-containing protein [Sphingomonas ursincola]MBA1373196.1 phage tail protein [Sphingomonas ursincola]